MIYQQPFNDPLNYYYYNLTFDDKQIKKILLDLESIEYSEASILGAQNKDDKSEIQDISEIRQSKIKWIPNTEEWKWVYERMMTIVLEANKSLWHFDIFNCEPIQYTEYHDYLSGHYDWHHDLGSGFASHRKISISVQLSDPQTYNGGELQIKLNGDKVTSIPKKLGDATIFPSYLLHRVNPVTTGTRKSLVMWVGGNHFR